VTWPGRWQRTEIGGRPLILDASHNPEGAQVLENNLHKLVAATGRKPVIITGILGGFRARALLDVICRYAKEVYLVPPHMDRASTYEELEAVVRCSVVPRWSKFSPTPAPARSVGKTIQSWSPAQFICSENCSRESNRSAGVGKEGCRIFNCV
jgi:hypothetical protein